MNSSFHIQFNSIKNYSPFIIIKLQIVSDTSIVSSIFINPGVEENLENKINDKYMSLIDWYKDKYKAIEMQVKFYRPANNLVFEVSYYDAETASDRSNVIKNPLLMNKIFSQKISLLIDATLDFFISTKDGHRDGVNIDDIAIVSCTSKNGVPPGKPVLKYIDKLKVKSQKFFELENKIVVYVYVMKSDHNKYIQCSSLSVSEYRYIKVFHHPTTLEFNPNYSNYMPNGSTVLCTATDGHPPPTVSWHFIEGPENASHYYKISNGNNLTILPNCPIETRWVFNCTALNSIPKSYDIGITRTFNFTIYPGSKIAGGVIGSIVSIFIFLIILFIVMRNKNLIKKIKFSRKHHKSKDINLGEDVPNNSNNYFTYPTVTQSNEPEEKNNKKKRNKKKLKADPLVDSQNEDFIV